MQRVFPIEEACMGCGICEVACSERHTPGRDLLKHYRLGGETPVPRTRRNGSGAHVFSLQCRHCEEPVCLYSCLTGAIYRGEDGSIQLDESKCIGCWTCVLACQYGAIERNESAGVAVKCDLCRSDDVPACVRACPNGALVYGSSDFALARKTGFEQYPELSVESPGGIDHA